MGRRHKKDRPARWHETVVADFMSRHPHGMYRPLDLEADPGPRIDTMPWWEQRPALFLVGCADPAWDADRMLLWAVQLAAAAEARNAVLEIACARAEAGPPVDFGRLGPRFRCRRRPDSDDGGYVHLARTPLDHDRPPPLSAAEVIATLS